MTDPSTDPSPQWVVRVYWETPDALDDQTAAAVLEKLHGHSAVLSRHPIDGIWEATVSVQAETIESAASVAFDLVAEATAKRPVSAEVLREHVSGRRRVIQPL
ncbi:MAG TPA: hypothetical protein PLZ93_08715 [Nocardioides sp.]|uniref:hypothetical protein n=1 Tax=uncultured Nocardioides sp. TaxID=198441 RepID=UPI000EBC3840|nr:hypothetical protein [uncultured Nocardioides sp.]HCB02990.1 hypothetical protein [Nocardioides sp.]HRD60063.1 hypothetical protein [Nocardioides sp.]HRI95681.1 hypothetical protein [Nocardioides sp.]HRK44215.1 hypothetical protein [Nocardioides sp.]